MFTPITSNHGAVPPWEYLPAQAGDYQPGQLLNADGGVLAPISEAANSTPGYLCMGKVSVAEGGTVPVTRVQSDYIYETELSKAADGAVIGTKLQVSAGGTQVNADAEGSFEVTYIEGNKAGDLVRGRFT